MQPEHKFEVGFTWYDGRGLCWGASRICDEIGAARDLAISGRETGIVPPGAEDLEVTLRKLRRYPGGAWQQLGVTETVVLETDLQLSPYAKNAESLASRESTEYWMQIIRAEIAGSTGPIFQREGKPFMPVRPTRAVEQTF